MAKTPLSGRVYAGAWGLGICETWGHSQISRVPSDAKPAATPLTIASPFWQYPLSMIAHLLTLADQYGTLTGLSHWQIGCRAAGSAKFFNDLRLRRRQGCSVATYARAVQWFSDHWPSALWPPDIPRPAPTQPEAPARPATAPPPASRAAVRLAVMEARARQGAAFAAEDWPAAERHEMAAIQAGLTLNTHGRILDPTALCAALNIHRHVYDDCVRRYAGHPERRPRAPRPGGRPSPTWRLLNALRTAGDRRFIRQEAT